MIKEKEEQFQGFLKPEYPSVEYFKLSQQFFNMLPLFKGEATTKILLYVFRHTLGYNDYVLGSYVEITTEEFMSGRLRRNRKPMDNGTGLSKGGVLNGIRRAIEQGFLEEAVDDTNLNRIRKFYRLSLVGDYEPIYPKPKGKLAKLGYASYNEYLNSPAWQKKREKALKMAGNQCHLCPCTHGLQVHHKTYERIGNEDVRKDLVVLCQNCHSTHHDKVPVLR